MRRETFYAVAAAVVAAACLGIAWFGPAAVAQPVVALMGLALLVVRPQLSLYLAFVLAFTTLPTSVPSAFGIGPFSVRAYEPFLFIAAAWMLTTRGRERPLVVRTAVGLAAFVLAWSLLGLARSNAPSAIVTDVRPLTYLIAAVVVGGCVVGSRFMTPIRRLMIGVLWFSAAMTLLSSATGLAVGGRLEQAAPYGAAATSDEATRLLTPATFLAVVVLCAGIAAAIYGGRRVPFSMLIPAFPIVVLAFSRNHLLAIAAAALFAFLASRASTSVPRVVGLSATVVLLLAGLTYGQGAVASLPGGGYVVKQVNGFGERVVEGISAQALARDSSAQYRFAQENNRIKPWVEDEPIIGWGFGKAYKAPTRGDDFSERIAPYYAHNYYWWLLLKAGVLGLIAFLWLTLRPAIRVLRRPSREGAVVAAPLTGLLAASFFAPMANGSPTSAILGALIGLSLAVGAKSAGAGPHEDEGSPIAVRARSRTASRSTPAVVAN